MKKFFFSGKKDNQPEKEDRDALAGESTVYLTGDDRVDSAKIRTLLDTLAELISSKDPDALLQTIVDRSIRLVGAERGILFLKENDGPLKIKMVRDAWGKDVEGPIQYSTGVVNKVVNTGEPVLLKVGSSEVEDLSQSVVDLKLRAVMCVTLSVKNRILGVIYVDSKATSREFKRSDLKFFDALANAMAITIENARLVMEYVAAERLKKSLEIAHGIQQGLLPQNPRGLPGFDIAGALLPVEVTAGDYYDFVPMGAGRLGLVVGDVTGHGTGPALVMSSVRAMLRALTSRSFELDGVLAYLNTQLDRDTEADIFMSFFLGVLDLEKKTLVYGNAGHIPQLLYKADRGEFLELQRTGIALGVEEQATYKASASIELAPGDLLALFTDGITETRMGKEFFGTDRLKQLLLDRRKEPAADIVSGIFEEVRHFGETRAVDDDLTLVVARIVADGP